MSTIMPQYEYLRMIQRGSEERRQIEAEQQRRREAISAAKPPKRTFGSLRAEWLHNNPPPTNKSSKQYADWIKSNPYATTGEKAHVDLLEKMNYSDVSGLTPQHIIQSYTPSIKELAGLREKYADNPEIASMSDAKLRNHFTIQNLDIAGTAALFGMDVRLPKIKHELSGVDATGNSITIKVSPAEYWNVKNQSPSDKLDDLIKLGLLPKGTKLVSNVKAFNKKYGLNLTKEAPYALPQVDRYIKKKERQDAAHKKLVQSHMIDFRGHLDLFKAIEKGIKLDTLRDAGFDISKKDFNSIKEFKDKLKDMPDYFQQAYKKGGIEGYNKAVAVYETGLYTASVYQKKWEESTEAERQKYYVQIGDKYIKREVWDNIDERYQRIAERPGGLDAMLAIMKRDYDSYVLRTEKQQEKYDVAMSKLDAKDEKGNYLYRDKDGNYDLVSFLGYEERGEKRPGTQWKHKEYYYKRPNTCQDLKDAGFSDDEIKVAGYYANLNSGQMIWQGMSPWDEQKGETATPKGAGIMAAEMIVPGVHTARHWNELSTAQKALSIGIDVLIILPILRAGAIAGRARAATAATKPAIIRSSTGATLHELRAVIAAPVNVIIHPVSAAKGAFGTVREVAENIAHPKKIPDAVITTTDGTVRLKVTKNTTAAEAMVIRDTLVNLAKRGERPVVEMGGRVYVLERSPLMQELGGGLVHSTPGGEAFENVLTVAKKPGMSAKEQGLFLSPEPLPRFAKSTAYGRTGTQPTIYILSRETAEKAVTTGKIYNSPVGKVAEIESKLPVGAKTAGTGQRFFTRVGPEGTKVVIWLDKPLNLTPVQIAKLKLKAIPATIKAWWSPALKIKGKGKGLTKAELKRLEKALIESGNHEQARNLLRANELARYHSARRAAPSLYRTFQSVSDADYKRATESVREQIKTNQRRVLNDYDVRRINAAIIERAKPRTVSRVKVDRAEGLRVQSIIARSDGRIERVTRAEPRADRVPPTRPPRVPPDRVPPTRPPRVPPDRVPPTRPPRVPPDRVPPTRPPRVPPDRVPPVRPPRVPPDRVPPTKAPPRRRKGDTETQQKKEWQPEFVAGSFAWMQGQLKGKGGKLEPLYYVIKEPYESAKDVFVFKQSQLPKGVKPTPGGLRSAYRSIQRITGRIPKKLFLDMGIMDLKFDKPGVLGKGKGLSFKADPKQKTKGDITLGKKGRVTYQKGNVKIVEKPDDSKPIINRKPVTSKRAAKGPSRVIDLGGGIVQERGRRHIKMF